MNKLVKLFPILPKERAVGALIGSIAFYLFVPGIAAWILGIIVGFIIGLVLGITAVLAPLAPVVGFLVGSAINLLSWVYTVMGIVFSIMSFSGRDFN